MTIALGARVKNQGEAMIGRDTELTLSEHSAGEMGAYERLLGHAMRGDATLFAREDGVEAAWQIVDRILGSGSHLDRYAQGSWGPEQAAQLVAGFGGWHNPGP